MGVDARLVVYAPDKATAEKACGAAFERIAALDSSMSDYRKDSELMRLCDGAGGPPIKVSPDLFVVLRRAQEISKRSRGFFDITVGPVVALWRKARKTHKLPDPAELKRARKLVGWQKVHLDAPTQFVRLDLPGMKLDLGGIAKGYADDEAQRVLKENGITRALVEMGGDIVVSGPPPGMAGWSILVPNAGPSGKPATLSFSNRAISTSGDTEQFVVIGGVRYSHVINPHTGIALTTRVQSTVVAPDGLTSDPISKVMTFLGGRERARFLKHYPGTRAFVRTLTNR
jgi:thiamine biosynthesis lipoprotein